MLGGKERRRGGEEQHLSVHRRARRASVGHAQKHVQILESETARLGLAHIQIWGAIMPIVGRADYDKARPKAQDAPRGGISIVETRRTGLMAG